MNDSENLSKLLRHLLPAVLRDFVVSEFHLSMPAFEKKGKQEQRAAIESVLTALSVKERQKIEEVAERIIQLSDGAGQDVVESISHALAQGDRDRTYALMATENYATCWYGTVGDANSDTPANSQMHLADVYGIFDE